MKNNNFWKIFIASLACILLIALSSIWVVFAVGEKQLENDLVANTNIIASFVNVDDLSNMDTLKNEANNRITIIDIDGNVLYDSESNNNIENHADREEILAAYAGTPKVCKRYSSTVKANMYYYAIKLDNEYGVYYVRLAVWSNSLKEYIVNAVPFVLLAVIVALIVAMFTSKGISNNIATQFKEIKNSIASINRGSYEKINAKMTDDQLYPLISEINTLFENTNKNLSTIKEEKNKLDFVMNHVSQGIIALNSNNIVKLVNNQANLIFECNTQAKGENISYIINKQSIIEKVINDTQDEFYSFESDIDDKTYIFNIINIKEGIVAHNISKIIIITDITNEKELIKQKSDFFYSSSHELKTPLTTVQGLSEILLTSKDMNENELKQVERINIESIRLNKLIQDMLKLSNLENKIESENVEVAVKSLINDVVEELDTIAKKKSIKTVLDVDDLKITGDSVDIRSLISNIYTNAINYNVENGTVNISFKEENGKPTLNIEDTGIGIDSKDIPRLCERFYRVDKSRSKKTGGTGLGLAIVKHICQNINAEMKIQSKINIGTKITIIFEK